MFHVVVWIPSGAEKIIGDNGGFLMVQTNMLQSGFLQEISQKLIIADNHL